MIKTTFKLVGGAALIEMEVVFFQGKQFFEEPETAGLVETFKQHLFSKEYLTLEVNRRIHSDFTVEHMKTERIDDGLDEDAEAGALYEEE